MGQMDGREVIVSMIIPRCTACAAYAARTRTLYAHHARAQHAARRAAYSGIKRQKAYLCAWRAGCALPSFCRSMPFSYLY